MSLPSRRSRGFGSALALAVAFAGAATVGVVAPTSEAFAQKKDEPQNSRGFVTAYQPVAETFNEGNGDIAAAKAGLPAVIAAVENERDRLVAGNLVLQVANKANDPALQRQGLELMLQSGQVAPEQVGQFQFFVGSLAMQAKDYPAARTALQAAVDAGYNQDNIQGLLAEAYFQEGNTAQGLTYLKTAIDAQKAAGQQVDNQWLLRGLKVAYESNDPAAASEWAALLVDSNPTPDNWLSAIQVVGAVNAFEPQVQLDLLRLMMETGSLKERRDFVTYIEAADPRIMATEVSRVLDAGTQAGVFNSSDNYYLDVKRVVDDRLSQDASAASELEADAGSDPRAAQNAGDVYLSLANYAKAEEMFKRALDGGADRDLNLTRLGIAQTKQGKKAEAKASFDQVSGVRAPVAKMWSAYVSGQA